MKRPTLDENEDITKVGRQFPRFLAYVHSWKQQELDQLPLAINSAGIAQGRCQVLQELVKLLDNTPGNTAKSQ